MNNKKILMIHEFKESFLNLPLEDYILTFDDGLFTQYLFLSELLKINTDKYEYHNILGDELYIIQNNA